MRKRGFRYKELIKTLLARIAPGQLIAVFWSLLDRAIKPGDDGSAD
jgi:hypothetical protein